MDLIENILSSDKPADINRLNGAGVDISTATAGTPGGIFMRQFWLVVYRSGDLPSGRVTPIRS